MHGIGLFKVWTGRALRLKTVLNFTCAEKYCFYLLYIWRYLMKCHEYIHVTRLAAKYVALWNAERHWQYSGPHSDAPPQIQSHGSNIPRALGPNFTHVPFIIIVSSSLSVAVMPTSKPTVSKHKRHPGSMAAVFTWPAGTGTRSDVSSCLKHRVSVGVNGKLGISKDIMYLAPAFDFFYLKKSLKLRGLLTRNS